jgi:indolepyruvate ferredoxin oxidoreductase
MLTLVVITDPLANGVTKVILITDKAENYWGVHLAGGTEVWHRDRLEKASAR